MKGRRQVKPEDILRAAPSRVCRGCGRDLLRRWECPRCTHAFCGDHCLREHLRAEHAGGSIGRAFVLAGVIISLLSLLSWLVRVGRHWLE